MSEKESVAVDDTVGNLSVCVPVRVHAWFCLEKQPHVCRSAVVFL